MVFRDERARIMMAPRGKTITQARLMMTPWAISILWREESGRRSWLPLFEEEEAEAVVPEDSPPVLAEVSWSLLPDEELPPVDAVTDGNAAPVLAAVVAIMASTNGFSELPLRAFVRSKVNCPKPA